jgi:hypothetical protein
MSGLPADHRAHSILPMLITAAAVGLGAVSADILRPVVRAKTSPVDRPALGVAQRLFYNGSYEAAAALALALQASDAEGLAARELRTSALHFQIRRALGESPDKESAFEQCGVCPDLMAAFLRDIAGGQTLARARLQANAEDQEARFLLGKIDLNYVWLQLGTLGRKTGWNEFREARRSLDAVLKDNPHHVRAQVAKAWIEYIVDTKVPRGFRWILGGGNKKRGLAVVRHAATAESDFFTKAEAGFALWEMQIREREFAEAVGTARGLARDFPDNRELERFLQMYRGL